MLPLIDDPLPITGSSEGHAFACVPQVAKQAYAWLGLLWTTIASVVGLKDWTSCCTSAASWNQVICLPTAQNHFGC